MHFYFKPKYYKIAHFKTTVASTNTTKKYSIIMSTDSPITSSPHQDRLDLDNITPISATLETLSPPLPSGHTSSTYVPRREPIPANRVALIRQIEEEEAIQEERCKVRQIVYKIMGILGSIVLILFIGYFSMYEMDLIRYKNPGEIVAINAIPKARVALIKIPAAAGASSEDILSTNNNGPIEAVPIQQQQQQQQQIKIKKQPLLVQKKSAHQPTPHQVLVVADQK